MITPMAAAKAYAQVQGASGLGAGDPAKAADSNANFGQMVQNAIADTVKTSKGAEGQMAAQVQGKASLIDVATAVSSAQASLETVMAVRDQVISAYQEIMRMTI
jgi:flagellar hook-basal body complex protein FliE